MTCKNHRWGWGQGELFPRNGERGGDVSRDGKYASVPDPPRCHP